MKGQLDTTRFAEVEATKFANEIQGAVNLYAISNEFVKQLRNLREANIVGDNLNNHPMVLAFVSKLNSLCRMNTEREMAALDIVEKVAAGEQGVFEYDVIPL